MYRERLDVEQKTSTFKLYIEIRTRQNQNVQKREICKEKNRVNNIIYYWICF